MKTMTCEEMGGPCSAAMTASTPEEMISMGMAHVNEAHPEIAEKIAAMTEEEQADWMAKFHEKWEAMPEDEETEAPAAETEEEPAA